MKYADLIRRGQPLFAALLLPVFAAAQSPCSILAFGARAGGPVAANTQAINAAIRACHDAGGGTVEVPAGTYGTGTIRLLSNINLHLEPGAVLLGSRDTSDYLPMSTMLFREGYTRYGLVYANGAVNVSITGQGELNGNGTSFMHDLSRVNNFFSLDRAATRQGADYMKEGTVSEDGPLSYDYRPGMLLTMLHCENLRLSEINIRDAPEWTMRIGDCSDVTIRGVSIRNNPLVPNNDGINCTNSVNVRIADCSIFTGDDAIAINGYQEDGPHTDSTGNRGDFAGNITVTNCTLSSRSSCIRVGDGTRPLRNLVFDNLVMDASNRGIGIFARHGTDISDVIFSNIVMTTHLFSGNWWGKGEPIHISAVKDRPQGDGGRIRNVRFSHITATAETGLLIYGSPEGVIENISFDQVSLAIRPGRNVAAFGGNFDLQPIAPASLGVVKHDIPGLYAQYVKDLSISGFSISWAPGIASWFTHAIEIHHFDGLRIDRLRGGPAFPGRGLATVRLADGKDAHVEAAGVSRSNVTP